MDALITLLICLPILIGLGILLIKLLKGLFFGVTSNAKALKTMVTRKGAVEAYEIMEDAAANGIVPEEAMNLSILKMAASGASRDEILNFVLSVRRNISWNADVARSKIDRAERAIHNLSKDQINAVVHGNYEAALAIQMAIERNEQEILRQQDNLEPKE